MKQETYNLWALALTLLQLVIVTCTAFWAWRYTQETVKLRESSQEQARATAKQLGVAQSSLSDLQAERRRASYPFFLTLIRSDGGDNYSLVVTNKGAPVHSITIRSEDANIHFTDQKHVYLEREGKLTFPFKGPSPSPESWGFQIRYWTLLGEKCLGQYSVIRGAVEYIGHM